MLYAYVKLGGENIQRSREILGTSMQYHSFEDDRFEKHHKNQPFFQGDGQNATNKD